jgi:hypothetical protein
MFHHQCCVSALLKEDGCMHIIFVNAPATIKIFKGVRKMVLDGE